MSRSASSKSAFLCALPRLPAPLVEIIIQYMILLPSNLLDVIREPPPEPPLPVFEGIYYEPVAHRGEKCCAQEIVHIQLGQGGNAIGHAFWKNLYEEHGLDPTGRKKEGPFSGSSPAVQEAYDRGDHWRRLGVYFHESEEKRYTPRAVLVDLDPGPLQDLRHLSGGMYRPENFVQGAHSAGKNWAKGYYSDGTVLVEPALEAVRREVERADCLQGFQMAHTLGGGTGSGLGSLLLSRLRDEYHNRMTLTFSIVHSSKFFDEPLGDFNTLMSYHHLTENAHQTVILDNQALHEICFRGLKISSPTLGHLNDLIEGALSIVTCPFRFPVTRCGDMRSLATQLVAFPRLHFYMVSYVPLVCAGSRTYRTRTLPELYQEVCDAKYMLCGADPRHGRYTSTVLVWRGPVSQREVDEQMLNVCNKNSSYYVEWIPNNVKAVFCPLSDRRHLISASSIGNNTAMSAVFRRVVSALPQHLHRYTAEGMEEAEFVDAQSNVEDLLSEYQQYQDATAYDDEYE